MNDSSYITTSSASVTRTYDCIQTVPQWVPTAMLFMGFVIGVFVGCWFMWKLTGSEEQ